MKKTFIIAAAALVSMTACNKTLIETPVSESDYGYINLGITADTEMSVITKAPVYNDYYVTLKQGSAVKWGPLKYSEVTDWKVAAGSEYTLYVENMTASEAAPANDKGAIHIAGTSNSFNVIAGVETPVTVSCAPVNSRVTVAYDESFLKVFTDPSINITDNTRAFDMTWGHEIDNGVYYPAASSISWTLNVTMQDGSTNKTYTCPTDETITTQADKWTKVTFSSGNTDGTIKVEITVDETIIDVIEVSAEINPLEGSVTE